MTVHFICRGNTYRSRLAETYLKSKQLSGIEVISSGIEADQNISGPINWYTQRIIQKEHLVAFEKPIWQQTTKELLNTGDLTVFVRQDIYDFCVNNFSFNDKKYLVWNIQDTDNANTAWLNADEFGRIKITEQTFAEIKQKVEELIVQLGKEKVV